MFDHQANDDITKRAGIRLAIGARTAMSASFTPNLNLSLYFRIHADKAVRAPMPSNRSQVFETIRNKRLWHTPPHPETAALGFRGWHSRGYLPHFDLPGLVQFINYRLDDALPGSLRHEWSVLLEIDDELKRRTKIEDYLDRGCGSCLLRDARAAAVVEENWLHFDNQDYRLLSWVVMPNHVHLLVEIWQTPQAQLVKDWKGFTARRINRLLGRRGNLWQDDYWDRYIRDEAHYRSRRPVSYSLVRPKRLTGANRGNRGIARNLCSLRFLLFNSCLKVVHYIEANPVKAGW